MDSFIIIANNQKSQLEKINIVILERLGKNIKGFPKVSFNKGNPDLLIILPEKSIGIAQVRQIQQFLSRKPYQYALKAVVLLEADKMTLSAQNAFLKTLEEPPKNSLIFLSTNNINSLIPTILSRCQIILENNEELKLKKNDFLALVKKILNSRVGERLKLIETQETTREKAILFCEQTILSLRKELLKTKSLFLEKQKLVQIIKELQKSLNLLNQNINPKLVLDNLVINLI